MWTLLTQQAIQPMMYDLRSEYGFQKELGDFSLQQLGNHYFVLDFDPYPDKIDQKEAFIESKRNVARALAMTRVNPQEVVTQDRVCLIAIAQQFLSDLDEDSYHSQGMVNNGLRIKFVDKKAKKQALDIFKQYQERYSKLRFANLRTVDREDKLQLDFVVDLYSGEGLTKFKKRLLTDQFIDDFEKIYEVTVEVL